MKVVGAQHSRAGVGVGSVGYSVLNVSTATSYPPGVPSTFCIAPASIAAQGEGWVPHAKWRQTGVGSGADRKVTPSLSWDRENSAFVAQHHYLGHLYNEGFQEEKPVRWGESDRRFDEAMSLDEQKSVSPRAASTRSR